MIASFVADGMESISDFLNLFDPDKSTAFKEISLHVAGKFPVKAAVPFKAATENEPEVAEVKAFTEAGKNLIISRVRTAWQEGIKAGEKAERDEANPPDVEAPMGKADVEWLDQSWCESHPWEQVPFMQATTRFRTRVFNELRLRALMLHTVEQAIEPVARDKPLLPVGPLMPERAALMMQTQPNRKRKVTCTLEYFAALRLLMGLYAYLGGYIVEYKREGAKAAEMMTFWVWGACLAYHDEVMMHTLAIRKLLNFDEDAILAWVRKRDEIIRMHMAYLVNQGVPGDIALNAAMVKFNFVWPSTDNEKLDHLAQDSLTTEEIIDRGLDQERAAAPHNAENEQARKRQRQERRQGASGGGGDGSSWPQRDGRGLWKVNTTPKGRSICGGFQTEVGCKKRNCPKEHVCAVIMGKNVVCGNKKHGACDHGKRR